MGAGLAPPLRLPLAVRGHGRHSGFGLACARSTSGLYARSCRPHTPTHTAPRAQRAVRCDAWSRRCDSAAPSFKGMSRLCRRACPPLVSPRPAPRSVAAPLSRTRALARAVWAPPHCSSTRARPYMMGAPHAPLGTWGEDARPGQTYCPAQRVPQRAQLCTSAHVHATHRTLAGVCTQRVHSRGAIVG